MLNAISIGKKLVSLNLSLHNFNLAEKMQLKNNQKR